jgi:hypothetical protein
MEMPSQEPVASRRRRGVVAILLLILAAALAFLVFHHWPKKPTETAAGPPPAPRSRHAHARSHPGAAAATDDEKTRKPCVTKNEYPSDDGEVTWTIVDRDCDGAHVDCEYTKRDFHRQVVETWRDEGCTGAPKERRCFHREHGSLPL